MSKQIIYGQDAKDLIKEGIDSVANAVKVTLGPKGQTVLIDSQYEEGRVTKDGISVAKAIEIKDNVKNAGAKIIKKIASKTAADAGDGTTTATVIAQKIVTDGARLIAGGVNPMDMKAGMDLAISKAVKYFKDNSKKVVDASELREIATISANGDADTGKIVADVVNEAGADGAITVETSKSIDTYVEKVSGLRFDRGFVSPYFMTEPNKGIAKLNNPLILVTDHRISTIKQIQKILEYTASNGRELLIIADDIQGEALTMLVVNVMRGTLKVCAVKAPAFGDRKQKELTDIAILTGAAFVSQELTQRLETINDPSTVLGAASNVTITSKTTTIVDGQGSKDGVLERVGQLRDELEEESSQYNKDIIKTRIAKLIGGVAVLYVGAITEVELNEKKDRIDDALCAARAANEEGTLPGGGIAYLNASMYLDKQDIEGNADFKAGYNLVKQSLLTPITQIVNNGYGEAKSYAVSGSILNNRDESDSDYGYDARNDEFVNMREKGIIDPAKVCRVAVENAASIAGMYLTTGCVIVEEPEEKKSNNPNM